MPNIKKGLMDFENHETFYLYTGFYILIMYSFYIL